MLKACFVALLGTDGEIYAQWCCAVLFTLLFILMSVGAFWWECNLSKRARVGSKATRKRYI